MESIERRVAIITAGGSGKRLPGEVKKQFRLLNERPVLCRTLDVFLSHPLISNIIVTLPAEDLSYFQDLCDKYYPEGEPEERIITCSGGRERQDSVYQALQICPADTEFVLIHDGVRPFITHDLINQLLSRVKLFGAVIPTAPVKNTIKSVKGDSVVKTLDRDSLVQVFTPQAFRYDLLFQHYGQAMETGCHFTDDAAVLEHYGISVHTYSDPELNLKITDEQDLLMAGIILNQIKE